MLKISVCPFSRFQNDEHFMYQTDFNGLITHYTPAALMIDAEYKTYSPLYTDEGEALNYVRKSTISDLLHTSDLVRDNTSDGIDDAIQSGLKHFSPLVREASARLKALRDTTGNITQRSYNKETADIIKLIADLKGPYAADVATLGIEAWVTELEANNNDFKELQKKRYDESDEKTRLRMKKVRIDVDDAHSAIVDKINALIIVNGEAPYVEFVNKLNLRIESYKNNLALYKGKGKTPPTPEKI